MEMDSGLIMDIRKIGININLESLKLYNKQIIYNLTPFKTLGDLMENHHILNVYETLLLTSNLIEELLNYNNIDSSTHLLMEQYIKFGTIINCYIDEFLLLDSKVINTSLRKIVTIFITIAKAVKDQRITDIAISNAGIIHKHFN